MTTPKPMKREELPPCPHGTVLDGVDPKQWGLCLESVGAFFYPCHLGQLKEIIAWLEQANGLSSPPPIAKECNLEEAIEYAVRLCLENYETLGKTTRNIVGIVEAFIRQNLDSEQLSCAPLAPGELRHRDADCPMCGAENTECGCEPGARNPPPLGATKVRDILEREISETDWSGSHNVTRFTGILNEVTDRILSALGLEKGGG